MKQGRIISICSAPAGSYAIIIVAGIQSNYAHVIPIVGFGLTEQEDPVRPAAIIPLVSDSITHRCLGGPQPLPDAFPWAMAWKSFAPGENGLRWAEIWQEARGVKIDEWDVRVWWPSKAPLFATADETPQDDTERADVDENRNG